MRLPAVTLLIALLAAGCMGPAAEVEPDTSAAEAAAIAPAVLPTATPNLSLVDVPIWAAGDAWTVTAYGFGEEEQHHLVVTGVESDAYILSSTSERTAAWDAMYDVSYVGRIRSEDLAGSQQGSPVRFFDFPLEDGKTWTTRWDNVEVALTATKSARGFEVRGAVEGEPYVEYDFVPELRWWSRLDFAEGYGIKVERVESGWRGEIKSATAKLLFESTPAAPVLSPGSASFTIDEGQTFGLVTLSGGGAHWARAFQLIEPSGTPYASSTIGNAEAEAAGRWTFMQEQFPPTAGQWTILSPAAHDPAGGFHLRVHQVAIEDRPVA